MLTPEMNLLMNRSDHTYQLIIRLSSNHILNPAVSVECGTFEETPCFKPIVFSLIKGCYFTSQ